MTTGASAVIEYTPRPKHSSKIEAFQAYIDERLSAGVWNAVVLLSELKARGYSGGYTILKDYLRPLRQQARGVAVRRFETPPGHQAQMDWGELGHLEMEEGRKTLYSFAFTLGHSRALFADIATDTKIATLLRLHEAAFAELGGVPREILYDRMKTVVLGTDERGETRWNPLLLDFAKYWGFTPRACRAYRPQTKGKVERSIGYIRRNFLCGRQASSVADLRGQLRAWVWQTANQRVHGTIHLHIQTVWQKEKAYLLPLSGRAPFPYASAAALEVLLFVMGETEFDARDERALFYKGERREWSERLDVAPHLLEKADPRMDINSARMEREESREEQIK